MVVRGDHMSVEDGYEVDEGMSEENVEMLAL